jgi:hypothetical protein
MNRRSGAGAVFAKATSLRGGVLLPPLQHDLSGADFVAALPATYARRFRLAAVDRFQRSGRAVVREHPLVDQVRRTSLRGEACAIMSGVWNEERVNIDSQCTEIALPLNALR